MRPLTTKSAVLCGLMVIGGAFQIGSSASQDGPPRYRFMNLRSLGGANTRGNSINDAGWAAGYSNLPGNRARHGTVWFYGRQIDLGTLGGPNSSVAWPVKNAGGLVVGIAQTAIEHPSAATWSCAAFFPGPDSGRYTCLGFAWESDVMRPLPTLGGHNGYAAGANNRREIVGWAENTIEDLATCAAPRTVQFRPVVWGPGTREIRELPLWAGDTAGAATAINDAGQAVGISGTCDQAVGRHTAKNAVLWENGTVINLGTLGGDTWNTPTAINRHGDVVGFASQAGDDPDAPRLRAFIWTRSGGMKDLGVLDGHATALALGINDSGQVVGTSCPTRGACHAFLYENGVMRDLNGYRVAGYTDHLTRAQDINDDGVITGATSGLDAFLAIPNRGWDGSAAAAGRVMQTPGGTEGVMQEPPHPLAPRHGALAR